MCYNYYNKLLRHLFDTCLGMFFETILGQNILITKLKQNHKKP